MLRVLIVHLIIAALADAQRIWPKYGVIMSDNYPQPYTAALKRRWVIEVDIGQKIELSFGYPFEIEEPADDRHLCTHDKLQVYDANNVNILFTRPCAATNPKPDSSVHRTRVIMFTHLLQRCSVAPSVRARTHRATIASYYNSAPISPSRAPASVSYGSR
jgi:hypothetical protein